MVHGTKNALKEFQSKAGLVSDGVIGSKTKAALKKVKIVMLKLILYNTSTATTHLIQNNEAN